MSGPKHTPGPWKVMSEGIVGFDPMMGLTLVATLSNENDAQMPANARLISAAPEMLAAWKQMQTEGMHVHRGGCSAGMVQGGECTCYVKLMESAIAKAEGKD